MAVTKIVENSAKKPPAAGKGRPKGAKNKTTSILKDAIIQAAKNAGGKDELVGYLEKQAKNNPAQFMTLLGKVLPLQVDGSVDTNVTFNVIRQSKPSE